MGRNKKYSGYQAYDHLDPDMDYKDFLLRRAVKEEWTYIVRVRDN